MLYATEAIFQSLCYKIEEQMTKEHITEFWVGNYGDFDRLCARAVRELQKKYPLIRLCLVIPYITFEMNGNKTTYENHYDEIIMAEIPLGTPKKLWILKCNEYMVEHSDFLIGYVQHNRGGAYQTLQYAKKKHKMLWNLAEK